MGADVRQVSGVAVEGVVEAAGVEEIVISDGALLVVAKVEGRVSVQITELSN